jgi:hypothetical protein
MSGVFMRGAKYTLEFCKKFVEKYDIECLSVEYKDALTAMEWKCKICGHTWSTHFSNIFHNGTRCKKCSFEKAAKNARKKTEDVVKECLDRGYIFLNKEYRGSGKKYALLCKKCNYVWDARYSDFHSGNNCPECEREKQRYKIEDCQKIAQEQGGECLSNKYENCLTKMEWKCESGHTWKAKFIKILKGQWCQKCKGKAKHTLKDCQELAEKKEGKCLSEEYINNATKLIWECKFKHQWQAKFTDIKYNNSWCPHCNDLIYEPKVRQIFEKIFNKSFPKTRPKWLKNDKTNYTLELDGYNQELNLAFEYNGEFHYGEIKGLVTSLEEQQYRDRIKIKLCMEKGVDLIIVPYTEKNNLEEFIIKELKKIGKYEENKN